MATQPDDDPGDDALEAALRTALERGVADCLGRRVVRAEPLAAGLGLRRFVRLQLDGPPGSAIARIDAPEDPAARPAGVPPEPPLEPLRAWLETNGLPVPRRYGHDPAAGIEYLEDLGDQSLEQAVLTASGERRRALYGAACALLPRLQAVAARPGVAAFERHLDRALFTYKADQLSEWLLPATLGRAASATERGAVHEAFAEIADAADAAPQRLAHRDFKAANLHLRPSSAVAGEDGDELVMIDLQGAFLAPPEYDLVCLLRDLHVALPEDEIEAHLARTRPMLPDAPAAEDFERRFTLLTLSRVGKDLSRFLYAIDRRGEARYRAFLPHGARSLAGAARRAAGWSPALGRLAELLHGLEGRFDAAGESR